MTRIVYDAIVKVYDAYTYVRYGGHKRVDVADGLTVYSCGNGLIRIDINTNKMEVEDVAKNS